MLTESAVIRSSPLSIEKIRHLLVEDFAAVNKLIIEQIDSDIELITNIVHHIIYSGGKRLRPLLVLLASKAIGNHQKHHIELAAIIEFVHTVTLLHDDVVDASELRRGRKTANFIWGNEACILVGDFLYSRAFQMMTALNSIRIMEILAQATNGITKSEVLQLMYRNDFTLSETAYMDVIRGKTATLFQAATQLGALTGHATSEQEQAFAIYGHHLGMIFQLIDDVLDYTAPPEQMGKNLGDDLAEGKTTLPLIYALRRGTAAQVQLIQHAIKNGGLDNITDIRDIIDETRALHYVQQVAQEHVHLAKQALNIIKPSQYRDALLFLVDFALTRDC